MKKFIKMSENLISKTALKYYSTSSWLRHEYSVS